MGIWKVLVLRKRRKRKEGKDWKVWRKLKMHYLKRRNQRRRRTWILIWTALVPRKRRRKRRRLISTIWIMKRIKKMKQMTLMLTRGRIRIVIIITTSCFKEYSVL